jgi:hypothetical protein
MVISTSQTGEGAEIRSPTDIKTAQEPSVPTNVTDPITPSEDPWWDRRDKRSKIERDFYELVMKHREEHMELILQKPQKQPESHGDNLDEHSSGDHWLFSKWTEGRVTILDANSSVGNISFSHPAFLKQDFKTTKSIFHQQIIILEGLGGAWVEVLGKTFDIPLRLFAMHACNPLDFARRKLHLPIGESPERHFIMSCTEILSYEVKKKHTGDFVTSFLQIQVHNE